MARQRGPWSVIRGGMIAAAIVLLTGSAHADDRTHKAVVAQLAFLAQTTPSVCTDFETNLQGVAAYLKAADLTAEEIGERYRVETRQVGQAFEASFKHDPEAACDLVWQQLGESGLGLLTDLTGVE